MKINNQFEQTDINKNNTQNNQQNFLTSSNQPTNTFEKTQINQNKIIDDKITNKDIIKNQND